MLYKLYYLPSDFHVELITRKISIVLIIVLIVFITNTRSFIWAYKKRDDDTHTHQRFNITISGYLRCKEKKFCIITIGKAGR